MASTLYLNILESGSDVTVSALGTVDTSGLTQGGTYNLTSNIRPNFGIVSVIPNGPGDFATRWSPISGPQAFGSASTENLAD